MAALPGVSVDCDTLVKCLLEAGVDPLATNDDGKTFLHIIFGRQIDSSLRLTQEYVDKIDWFVEDRAELLQLLSEELSGERRSLLVNIRDCNGDTVLHKYAMNTMVQDELILCEKLLGFGASLRIPNNSGEVPLHYAHYSSLFDIFIQKGAVCRARNDRDETPVLFILKKALEFAFAETSAAAELESQGYVEVASDRMFIESAERILEELRNTVSYKKPTTNTFGIPDLHGNTSIDLVLIAIRIESYDFRSRCTHRMGIRTSLMQLLCEMVRHATPIDMKHQNSKGQSLLHVLLDMGDDQQHKIIQEIFVLQSLQILLEHQTDVNAVDLKGRTPLDITREHFDKGPALYNRIANLLIERGAVTGKSFSNQPSPESSLLPEMSNLCIQTRKLRSCPKRHGENARSLTNPSTEVVVVGKYRYSNQYLIGTGAFSSVFIAIKDEYDSKTGIIECRAYALKRLEKAKINPQEIKREITTFLKISGECDNIIKCHETVEDRSFQYLCLELMDGDLNEFVNNENVNKVMEENPSIHVQIAKEIIDGLAYLHKKKFIHRDLKPGNILYTTDPKLHFKITDFGLTKNLSTSSSMTSTRGNGIAMAAGTRCWMAPELVSMTSREHTEQSDIFSLGLVLHYLLTLGKHPFATRNDEPPYLIERKIVDMQISLDLALGPEAISLFKNLLTKDPSKRIPAAYLKQHPFLWSESKKTEFLKAVGDQPEAVNPFNSAIERSLQMTNIGQRVTINSWERSIQLLYAEMMRTCKFKKYRTDKVIDLLRFIRNAYAHKQERSLQIQKYLDENIFLRVYPTLVLDVFSVVQQFGLGENRSNIRQALSLNL
ncbi:serine/threonine-protein kinase/endoribonuclease IRE1-like [Dendronephthya gigantea]|uniref:serine/threonine-protein kinase/endoribonuclease IRE1-like n=1 Tax=Dendronephthya gigantea TaxID=151771 RepID=UPI00106A6C45|nr:serine/threonine-protein kinase/endoribonuclease IRE1-like [Dendronephthya gigantea]